MKRSADGAQQLPDLLGAPDEEAALLPLRVGVGGRVEAPLGRGHLPQQIVQGLAQHPGEVRPPGHLPGLGVGHRQQGVVVEHLLEVGDQPALVGRVAVEPAADLIVEAAGRHLLEGAGGHLQRLGVAGAAVAPAAAGARGCWRGTSAPAADRRGSDRTAACRCRRPPEWAGGRARLRRVAGRRRAPPSAA